MRPAHTPQSPHRSCPTRASTRRQHPSLGTRSRTHLSVRSACPSAPRPSRRTPRPRESTRGIVQRDLLRRGGSPHPQRAPTTRGEHPFRHDPVCYPPVSPKASNHRRDSARASLSAPLRTPSLPRPSEHVLEEPATVLRDVDGGGGDSVRVGTSDAPRLLLVVRRPPPVSKPRARDGEHVAVPHLSLPVSKHDDGYVAAHSPHVSPPITFPHRSHEGGEVSTTPKCGHRLCRFLKLVASRLRSTASGS